MGIAIGQMGLDLETYLSLTPFEFQEVYKAFVEKASLDREWQELKDMRVARWQVFRTLCPPQQKTISVYDLIELPGDKEQKERIEAISKAKEQRSTQERFEELKNKWKDE